MAIDKTEFQRLSCLLKGSKEELCFFATTGSDEENDEIVMNICAQFREILVNALWPETFQPFIQKAEGIWKRSFHTKRLKAMEGK